MIDLFGVGEWISSTAGQLAWQSTAMLALGLIASSIVAMRPSRSHRILLASALACLVVAPASLVARGLDVGLMSPAPVHRVAPERAAIPAPARAASMRPGGAAIPPPRVATANARAASSRSGVRPVLPELRMADVFLAVWGVLTAAGLLRLVASFIGGQRLKAGAAILKNRNVLAAAEVAARGLGLSTTPEVRSSRFVQCPVVWCWGRRPVLILPEALAGMSAGAQSDWTGVLCHELAHWKRADHVWGLAAELLTCVFPWQPLAWLVRARMATLSELACDDWALTHARTLTPHGYAETLLGLAIERRRPLVPAAVSGRSGLFVRVRHILEEANPRPRTGLVWSTVVAGLAIGLVAVLALARSRQARAVDVERPPAEAAAGAKPTTIDGRVVRRNGEPVTGADVYVVGVSPPRRGRVIVSRDDPDYGKQFLHVLARVTSDVRGQFSLDGPFEKPTRDGPWTIVVAHKPGLAPSSVDVYFDGKPVELVVEPAVPITGRLLGPGGDPVAGVSVRLEEYTTRRSGDDVPPAGAMQFGEDQVWDARPTFYPDVVRTDNAGRFVLDGFVPDGVFADLVLSHPAHAVEEVTVWTGKSTEPAPELAGSSVRPPSRDFTHTLAPARPVVGRITDALTGAPLVGVGVEVIPMRKQGGKLVATVTDSDGRYRVSGRDAETYWVSAHPARGSGYLAARRRSIQRPEGESELRVDMGLRRGVVLRGRVIDDDTSKPVPYVSVAYQPRGDNSHVQDDDDFDSLAHTDAAGRFAVTGLPGPGVVVAEAPPGDFIRRAVKPVDFGHSSSLYLHALARLDVPAGGEAPEIVMTVKRGFTLKARAVRPDGSAVKVVRAWCPELTARLLDTMVWLNEFDDGQFELRGAEPGRSYRVFFLGDDQKYGDLKYGAVVELKADPGRKDPVDVALQPTASLRGRVLDADGTPIVGAQVLASIQLIDKGSVLSEQLRFDDLVLEVYNQFTGEPLKRVHPAEFRYNGLIPGVRYFVTWYTRGDEHFWHAVEALGPGEDRDVGDIRADRKERTNGD